MSERDFFSLCRAGFLKLHGGVERVFNAFTCSGKSKFLSQEALLNCSVKKLCSYTPHTYVLNSRDSSLYCSLLIFRLMNWRGGKRRNRRRTQGGPSCPAPCPDAHIWQPLCRAGLQGVRGTCPALSRGVLSLPKRLWLAVSSRLSSRTALALGQWRFLIYI